MNILFPVVAQVQHLIVCNFILHKCNLGIKYDPYSLKHLGRACKRRLGLCSFGVSSFYFLNRVRRNVRPEAGNCKIRDARSSRRRRPRCSSAVHQGHHRPPRQGSAPSVALRRGSSLRLRFGRRRPRLRRQPLQRPPLLRGWPPRLCPPD